MQGLPQTERLRALEANFLNIVLGFLVGLFVAKVSNKVRSGSLIKISLIMAQVQSLRILSKSIEHFYTIRHWHEKAAWSLDEAHNKLKKELKNKEGVLIKLPDGKRGFIELTDEDIEEISDNWLDSRVQELKAVWNAVEHDDDVWKKESVSLLKIAMDPYDRLLEWGNWKEAMEYLAKYEILLLEYTKELKNSAKKS